MARRKLFFARHQFWRRTLLVVLLAASVIAGYQLFQHGKPVDPGDLGELTPNYTISVYVSNPRVPVDITLASALPSEYAATDPDSDNRLTFTVLTPPNTVVRYIVVIDPQSIPARFSNAPELSNHLAFPTFAMNGTPTRPFHQTDWDFVGQAGGPGEPRVPQNFSFELLSSSTLHDGALEIPLPLLEPGFQAGTFALAGEECGAGPSANFRPQFTVTAAEMLAGLPTNYCHGEHATQNYFYPDVVDNIESQSGVLGAYQLLIAQPSEDQIANDSITWQASGPLAASFAAVLPGTADRRSTYTFLAGIALAVTGGTAIALVQEIRDSEEPEEGSSERKVRKRLRWRSLRHRHQPRPPGHEVPAPEADTVLTVATGDQSPPT